MNWRSELFLHILEQLQSDYFLPKMYRPAVFLFNPNASTTIYSKYRFENGVKTLLLPGQIFSNSFMFSKILTFIFSD